MSTSRNISAPGSNEWLGFVAASAGLFLGSLDITVNVALPNITESFGTDVQTVQWIIVFYVGGTTGLQLSLGSAADIYGLKRFYVLGVAVYTVAVLLIGLAPTLPFVFGLRVLQALGNGLIMASTPALVTRMFPAEQRGRALGLMAGLGTLGMVIGALGGGALVDTFGWRSIFIARVPLGVLTAMLALASLREGTRGRVKPSFDLRGAATLFVGLASLILALTLGGRVGWAAPQVLGLLVLGAMALAVFVAVEMRATQPVLDLTLLRHRVLAPAVVSAYLAFLAMFVNFFILPFYVSDTLMLNAKALGLLLAVTPVVLAVAAPVAGRLSDEIAPAYLITLGLVVIGASMLWFSQLDARSSGVAVALRMGATGIGMGLFQASNANLVMGTMRPEKLATGGAIMALSRSMGTVSSVAIMSVLFAARLDAHVQSSTVGMDGSDAFVMAFRDTYRVSALLAAFAAFISVSLWPAFLRR